MRRSGFQFQVGGVSRRVAACLVVLLSATGAHAQAGFTWKYEPRSLGAADRYGYAVWSSPLASLPLGGNSIPLRLEFTTDPRPSPAPSPLGRGWSVNFFSSAVVEVDQDSIRWHRPDGRVFYFILGRGNSSAKKPGPDDPVVFKSKDEDWLALKTPKKRLITLRHPDSGAELTYAEGLLVGFTFGGAGGGERYAISYNRLRRPARLSTLGAGKIIAEFVYDDAGRATELRVGGVSAADAIAFEYADADLNQFSPGPYLSKVGDTALNPLAIEYRGVGGDANSVRFERLASANVPSLVWDSVSGFIRSDESSTYKIENSSLANAGRPVVNPKATLAERPSPKNSAPVVVDYNWRPEEARVTRIDNEGKKEYRHYDRAKGVATRTSKDGVKTLTYYLLTPGAMHGKVRKIEQIRGKESVVIARNAYDEAGRMVRSINASGDTSLWEYTSEADGSMATRKYMNGAIVSEQFSKAGDIILSRTFAKDGVSEHRRERIGGNTIVRLFKDNKFESEKTISEEGNLIKYLKADGTLMEWVKVGGQVHQVISVNGKHVKTLSAAGKILARGQ